MYSTDSIKPDGTNSDKVGSNWFRVIKSPRSLMMSTHPCSLPSLPDDIISEINTLFNQNQLFIEMLALRHCELQRRLDRFSTGFEKNKHFRFSRRRDLWFMFECGEQILSHYMEQEYQHYSSTGSLERRMSISVKLYVRDLLESFVENASSHCDTDDERESTISECPSARSFASSEAMSLSSSLSSRSSSSIRSSPRERDMVYESEESVEVQLEMFVPTVSFSEHIQYFDIWLALIRQALRNISFYFEHWHRHNDTNVSALPLFTCLSVVCI